MSILSGEKCIVETLDHLVNRTDFSYEDILKAQGNVEEIIQDYNSTHSNESYFDGPISELEEMYSDDLHYYINQLDTLDAIISLLENDERDWVHLYDGTVHTIVKIYQ